MAGKIYENINLIIDKQLKVHKGCDRFFIKCIKTKLKLKGIKINDFDENSKDDKKTINKLKQIYADLHN